MDPVNIAAKFEVRSFTRSWDNRGYSTNLESPWIRPRSFFSHIFKGLLLAWTLWIHLPNVKFVALPIPEIIVGTQQWAVFGYAHAPFSPKFFTVQRSGAVLHSSREPGECTQWLSHDHITINIVLVVIDITGLSCFHIRCIDHSYTCIQCMFGGHSLSPDCETLSILYSGSIRTISILEAERV